LDTGAYLYRVVLGFGALLFGHYLAAPIISRRVPLDPAKTALNLHALRPEPLNSYVFRWVSTTILYALVVLWRLCAAKLIILAQIAKSSASKDNLWH